MIQNVVVLWQNYAARTEMMIRPLDPRSKYLSTQL